jgi:hypothetical protein
LQNCRIAEVIAERDEGIEVLKVGRQEGRKAGRSEGRKVGDGDPQGGSLRTLRPYDLRDF